MHDLQLKVNVTINNEKSICLTKFNIDNIFRYHQRIPILQCFGIIDRKNDDYKNKLSIGLSIQSICFVRTYLSIGRCIVTDFMRDLNLNAIYYYYCA